MLMLTGRASPFLHNGIMEPAEADLEGGYVFKDGKVASPHSSFHSAARGDGEERHRLPPLEHRGAADHQL
jgi:hypothetical protein